MSSYASSKELLRERRTASIQTAISICVGDDGVRISNTFVSIGAFVCTLYSLSEVAFAVIGSIVVGKRVVLPTENCAFLLHTRTISINKALIPPMLHEVLPC